MLAADAPALFRGRDPPGAAAPEVGDLGRCVDARAERLRPDQQARGHLARIDGEIGGREQRGGVIDAEARAQRGAIEKRRVDAGRAAQLSLAFEIAHAEAVAREIERAARLRFELALDEIACEIRDREARAPPRADRIALADLALQFGERHVDFVGDQRRARDGRALRRPPPIDNDRVEPGFHERVGDHRAGDAGADDQHLGAGVAGERAMRHARRAHVLPERAVGPQFALVGDHEAGCDGPTEVKGGKFHEIEGQTANAPPPAFAEASAGKPAIARLAVAGLALRSPQGEGGEQSADRRWCGSAAPDGPSRERTDLRIAEDHRPMTRAGAPLGALLRLSRMPFGIRPAPGRACVSRRSNRAVSEHLAQGS